MLSSLLSIAVLHWAVLLVPGFNVVLLAQLAGGQSRSVAFAAVAGMTTATLVWATLAVMGIGAVFSTLPVLRQGAQIAGGLYLLYLAWNLWRSGTSAASVPPQTLRHAAAFRVGFMTSALNPKIALFYGSVFATALPPSPSGMHVVSAVAVVYLNSVLWHGSLVMAFSQQTVQQAYLRNFARLTRVSGAVVGAFGLKLIVGTLQELRARVP